MTETKTSRRSWQPAKVDLPEGEHGTVAIKRFEVPEHSLANMRLSWDGRGTQPGWYTMLTRHGRLWMSDTDAERRDQVQACYQIRTRGGRVLVGGLGLGMTVAYALEQENVTHVDVVEIDPDVIALVGPTYLQDPRVTIHEGDLFEQKWPRGTRWDVAWFDVWADVSTDDAEAMTRLKRSYGRRAGWVGCWGEDLIRQARLRGW